MLSRAFAARSPLATLALLVAAALVLPARSATAQTGACCHTQTVVCTVTTPAECTPPVGFFVGPGTTCTPDPCPAFAGACCFFSGSCAVMLPAGCGLGGREFKGVGTTCTPGLCVGACCHSQTLACEIIAPIGCFGPLGVYRGDGSTCEPDPCAAIAGACCFFSGACTVMLREGCGLGGREFKGVGTACTPGLCVGACCDASAGVCHVIAPIGCQDQYLGDDTVCETSPCPAACCDPTSGACMVIPRNTCTGLVVSGTCDPNPCPPVALCRDVTIDASTECIPLTLTPADIDNGSHAAIPNCPVTLALSPPGPYPVGQTTVTLTVTDCRGLVSTCTAVVTVLGDDCNHDGIPDICQCLWDSIRLARSVSDLDGQISHFGGAAGPGARVADDFYLCPGQVHRVFQFSGLMLTNLLPELRKARLLLFEDCDGVPIGEPVRSWDTTVSTQLAGPTADGFYLVRYTFDLCDDEDHGPLWLEGGRTYWWSLIGLGVCGGNDLSSWVAGTSRIAGSPPVKSDGNTLEHCYPVAFDPWQPLDECCIGCVNMTYRILGVSCPIIWDNGPALTAGEQGAGGIPSEDISPILRPRGADDLVTKTCADQRICLIDAWIWSSCDPVRGFVEIYTSDCREPGSAYVTLIRPQVIPTGQSLVLGGAVRQGYILRFDDLDLTLPRGRTWWLSAGADRTGSQAARTWFAFGGRCGTCVRHGSASQSYTPPPPVQWNDVGPDLAFRIAAAPEPVRDPTVTLPPIDTCDADINRSGSVTVQDIFDFLAAWFAGCP